MRLIFVNRFYWPDESATSLMLTDLAQALAAAGHDVHILTSRQLLENPAAKLQPEQTQAGVNILRLRTTQFGRKRLLTRAIDYLSFYLSALLHLLLNLRRGDVVIAKTDPPLIGVVAGIAVRLRGARLVNWLQDVYPEVATRLGALSEKSLLARLLRSLRNHSLRIAAANVAIGAQMRRYLENAEPRRAPVTVIHNWSTGVEPQAGANPYREQFDLQDKVVFGYSGNLGRVHDFAALLQVGEKLRGYSNIHFLITGGGAQMPVLRAAVRERGLKNWSFQAYQPREKLSESLGAADVHLVSLNPAMEGLIVPSKIYGILAAGRPAIFIGDKDSEVAQLLREKGCGLSCAAEDATGLLGAILELAQSSEQRARMGANARKAHEKSYAFNQAVNAWQRLLKELQ